MIHISGLGMAGSYLLRRLLNEGFEVSAYDPKRENYYLPCGYATNENLLEEYLSRVDLHAESYVISRARSITFSGHNFGEVSFGSRGMCTIDKKRLEMDLVSGFSPGKYENSNEDDVLVDATGISRALLGRHPGDYTMHAREYLTAKSPHDDFYFYFFKGGHGYYWEFPMGVEYHIGAGSDDTGMIDDRLSGLEYSARTGRSIRLTPLFDEVYRGNIVGVGEAVGTVSPITGEGIIPSIKSSEMLFQALKKYQDRERAFESYRSELVREFGYYGKLREIVRKVQQGVKLSLTDIKAAGSAKKDLEKFGIDFRLSKVIRHFI